MPGTVMSVADRRTLTTDAALVAAALGGQERAVAALFDRHAAPLYRLAKCLVGPAAAESVVVDVLVHSCTRPGVVTLGESLRCTLIRLVCRRCRQLGAIGG